MMGGEEGRRERVYAFSLDVCGLADRPITKGGTGTSPNQKLFRMDPALGPFFIARSE